MKSNPILTREEAGLPPKARTVQVLHHRRTAWTLLELEPQEFPPRRRLFARRLAETAYTPIGGLTDEQSIENLVIADQPCAFARVLAVTQRNDFVAANVLGIVRIDLDSPSLTLSNVDLTALVPQDAWISRLLRADGDGNLEAVVAFRSRQGDGSVEYVLCLLDLASQRLQELDVLQGVYF